jgi:hypothetical protein
MMQAQQKTAAEKLNDAQWDELFAKTCEAIRLFAEKPDFLRGFLNALAADGFPKARSFPGDWRREEDEDGARAAAGRAQVAKRKP